ncbi:MAG: hypothetical protein ABSD81_00845 [Methanomicrobiales archaeon]|jgi:hypothetical protein
MATGTGSLNESQARRLRVTCQHIDRLLSDIEDILNESASKTAFPRCSSDITPAQQRAIEDYIARIRASLIRILEGQGISREQPSVPASRAVAFTLVSIDIAVEELKPKYMRGFGPVTVTAGRDLNKIAGELHGLVSGFDRYLAGGRERDPGNS